MRQRDLQPVRLSEAEPDCCFTCAARTLLSPGNDPAAGLHLPANQRTDLHERNMPEEAAHIHPKMLLIELTLTQEPYT
jgi:hypothetical protein